MDGRAVFRCKAQAVADCAGPSQRKRRVLGHAAFIATLAFGLIATTTAPPRPRLVWNASASAPVGLYAVGAPEHLDVGDMVIAWTPEPARMLAARRHYLPANLPLVKRIAAAAGDRVCAGKYSVRINGRLAAARLAEDRNGRALPAWSGCRTLGSEEYLLLMDRAESFDGRYFGVTSGSDVIGRAWALWVR